MHYKSIFCEFQRNPIKPSNIGISTLTAVSSGCDMLSTPKYPRMHLDWGLGSLDCRCTGKREAGLECRFGSGKVMADSREVMNIRQASQYLGVSPDTLYKYVNEQKIPAFKLGNRWRFKKSKLDQWMEEQSMEMEAKGKKKIKAAVKAAGTL
jgi:excisionase family DNA binding protein